MTARRRFLATAAGLVAAGAAPARATHLTVKPFPHPDAALLACCTEAMAIDAESNRLWAIWLATPEIVGVQLPEQLAYDAHEVATLGRWHDLVGQVCTLPARTPEGLRAKIAVAHSAYPAERRDDPDPCDRLALAAFADVLAGGAA